MPLLRVAFFSAECCLHANRGLVVPQGLANNLEDLQRTLEGLTNATVQEHEYVATIRAQIDILQAAISELQL